MQSRAYLASDVAGRSSWQRKKPVGKGYAGPGSSAPERANEHQDFRAYRLTNRLLPDGSLILKWHAYSPTSIDRLREQPSGVSASAARGQLSHPRDTADVQVGRHSTSAVMLPGVSEFVKQTDEFFQLGCFDHALHCVHGHLVGLVIHAQHTVHGVISDLGIEMPRGEDQKRFMVSAAVAAFISAISFINSAFS